MFSSAQRKPCKRIGLIITGKARVSAAVVPPTRGIGLRAVACLVQIVIVVKGCEFHAVMIPVRVHGCVGQRVSGVSGVSGNFYFVLVNFRCKREGRIFSVEPFSSRLTLDL